ncbi:hypothetical protein [Sphaerisporangium fuscum]|uniref:hypothetical protein n=1 Tax=Sphaerisporangium fuscum TaxID=2835868 RepID=UPI001BDCD574|nr:hypothetical protein [Sphaerisporangium fuscum]
MSLSWRHLPEPARSIAEGTAEAVAAAGSRDLEAFQQATARLAALGPGQVGLVLGEVVRSLLEDLHHGGLAADDVQALVERCTRSASEWLDGVSPDVLVILVAGALGVHQAEVETFGIDAAQAARHGALLVADLIAVSGHSLNACLGAVFADIARAEASETP